MKTFRIDISYSEADLAAYEAAVQRRRGLSATIGWWWAAIATGFVAALAGGFYAVAQDIVAPSGGSFVAMLVFGGFWIGVWAPSAWAWATRRQRRRVLLGETGDASLLLTAHGLFVRRPGRCGFYRSSAIRAAGVEQGLVLLWVGAETAIAVPTRLLEPDQRAALLALAAPGGSSTAPR